MDEVNAVSFNIGPKGNVKVKERRKAYLKAIDTLDPDVLLLQEVKSKLDLKSIQQSQSNPKYDVLMSIGEAKVMCKKEIFSLERISLSDSDMNARGREYNDAIDNADLKGRIELCKLTRKTDGRVIYVASVHGQHKIKGDKKKDQLDALLAILTRKCGTSPLLIGGDFNLKYKDARRKIEARGFSGHYGKETDIDYFLTKRLLVTNDLQTYDYDKDEAKLLDHNPIIIDVKLQPERQIVRLSQ